MAGAWARWRRRRIPTSEDVTHLSLSLVKFHDFLEDVRNIGHNIWVISSGDEIP